MSTSQRTHNGGLYCSEGSTHVSRPSVRVAQPPGGGQTGGWLNGYSDDQKPVEKPVSREQNRQQEPVETNERQSVRTNRSNESSFSLAQDQAPPPKQEYNALYCTEGNQVRNRPSVRVHGEKSRGYNILHQN
jgi:hypothetical protein